MFSFLLKDNDPVLFCTSKQNPHVKLRRLHVDSLVGNPTPTVPAHHDQTKLRPLEYRYTKCYTIPSDPSDPSES